MHFRGGSVGHMDNGRLRVIDIVNTHFRQRFHTFSQRRMVPMEHTDAVFIGNFVTIRITGDTFTIHRGNIVNTQLGVPVNEALEFFRISTLADVLPTAPTSAHPIAIRPFRRQERKFYSIVLP